MGKKYKLTESQYERVYNKLLREGKREGYGVKDVYVHNDEDEVELSVSYSYYYDPGQSYMSNGDPGYPDESSIDILSYETVDGSPTPSWVTDEMVEDALDEIDVFSDIDYDDYDDYDDDDRWERDDDY